MTQTIRRIAAMLVAAAAALILASPAAAASGGTTSSSIAFRGAGGAVLQGTVVAPLPLGGDRPGVVLVGGSYPERGTELMQEAEAFARGGVVTLVYDKRTAGYSTFVRSYALLAADALAAVDALRAHPGVNPSRVGLSGFSEGGWVVPLAASRSADVAFVITVGAAGVPPSRQQAWSDRVFLGHAGVSGSLLQTYADTTIRVLVSAGLFAEANYDPAPAWEHVRQPVLALWGADDRVAGPYEEESRLIRAALERGGNRRYTMRVFPGARHDLHVTYALGFDRASYTGYVDKNTLAPGYARLVTSWIAGLAGGTPDASADPPPPGSRATAALAPLPWYESAPAQLAAYALLLLAFAPYAVAGLVRRIRHRPLTRRVGRAAGLLAATGLGAVVGLPLYLAFLLGTGAGIVVPVGPVVAGRPVPWLALQLLAAITVAAGAATAVRWWQARHQVSVAGRVQVGVLIVGVTVFLPWAVYWGLLRP